MGIDTLLGDEIIQALEHHGDLSAVDLRDILEGRGLRESLREISNELAGLRRRGLVERFGDCYGIPE